MEQMRNLLRSSTTATGGEGSEISTPRSSLSSSHRATPSFNDLSFGASVDGAIDTDNTVVPQAHGVLTGTLLRQPRPVTPSNRMAPVSGLFLNPLSAVTAWTRH